MDDKDAQLAVEWTKETGLALVYPCGSKGELERIWKSWQKMP